MAFYSGISGDALKDVAGYFYDSANARLVVPALHTSTETVDGTVAAGVIKAARGNLLVSRSDAVEPTRNASIHGPQGVFTPWGVTLPAVGPGTVGQTLRVADLTAGDGGEPLFAFDYPTMLPTTDHLPAATAVALVKNRVNLIDTSVATGAVTASLPANTALVEGDWCLVRVVDTTQQVTIAAGAGSTTSATGAELGFAAASAGRTFGMAYDKSATNWQPATNTVVPSGPGFFQGYQSSTVLIVGTPSTLDTDWMESLAAGNSTDFTRVTDSRARCQRTGYYVISAQVDGALGGTGSINARINGISIQQGEGNVKPNGGILTSSVYQINSGNSVGIRINADSTWSGSVSPFKTFASIRRAS